MSSPPDLILFDACFPLDKKVGFKHIIVASFSHMTRLGDTFIRQLKEKGEDFTKLYAFSEFLESVDPTTKVPDTNTIPTGCEK